MTKYPNRQSKTTAKTMAQNKNTSFVSGYSLLNSPFFALTYKLLTKGIPQSGIVPSINPNNVLPTETSTMCVPEWLL
jgi:hypothetical protein